MEAVNPEAERLCFVRRRYWKMCPSRYVLSRTTYHIYDELSPDVWFESERGSHKDQKAGIVQGVNMRKQR